MKNPAVIFDFNGTMLFDTPLQYQAWNRLAEETLGHGIDGEEFLRRANGSSSRAIVRMFWGSGLSEREEQALIHRKRQTYQRLCLENKEEFRLADGIPELLDLLQAKGIPFTIATSSHPDSVDFYYKHLRLDKWFLREDIVCADGHLRGKPKPDIYFYAALRLKTAPRDCVVVEDAVAGTQAARAARIGYIVLIDPAHDRLVRAGAQADVVVANGWALYRLLLGKIMEKKD